MQDLLCAPNNMEQLYRSYSGYVRGLVQRFGIAPQESEDAAADIMARLYERDIIGMFDPEHHIERNGEVIPARFKSFLSHQVALYARGKRDAINRRTRRELLIADQAVEDGGTSWLEAFGGASWDDYSKVSADEFVAQVRSHLATVPPRNARDTCDLLALFDEMVRATYETGAVSYPAIQERFGISSTSAYAWVAWLRECIARAVETARQAVDHSIGGITLSDVDLACAVKILKDAKGVMVKQPLARAGHKLQHAADGWYHEFSKQEQAEFPELTRIPGSHQKPKDHVKVAVIHRMERLLGRLEKPLSGPTEPQADEALSPMEELEAELWHAGLQVDRVDKILGLVRQVTAA